MGIGICKEVQMRKTSLSKILKDVTCTHKIKRIRNRNCQVGNEIAKDKQRV
jgi:hypothetical protein